MVVKFNDIKDVNHLEKLSLNARITSKNLVIHLNSSSITKDADKITPSICDIKYSRRYAELADIIRYERDNGTVIYLKHRYYCGNMIELNMHLNSFITKGEITMSMEDLVRKDVVNKFEENTCMWTKEEEDAEVNLILCLVKSDQVA